MNERKENRIIRFVSSHLYLTISVFLALIAAMIVYALINFYGKVFDREYVQQTEFLEELSQQGGMIVEERLKGYVNVLHSAAEYMKEGELQSEDNRTHLTEMLEQGDLGFQRIGLADAQGNSWVTGGVQINIGELEYFQKAMGKQNVITESRDSKIVDERIFIVAVPVLDAQSTARGVLYGIVEIDKFHIYDAFDSDSLMNSSSYIQVIDRNGAYIVKSSGEHTDILGDNIFEGMKQVETSLPLEEITRRIGVGERVAIEARWNSEKFLVYFSPLSMNNWYMVTVLEKASVGGKVQYLLGKDVYILLFQSLLAFAAICIGISWYLHRDKKRMAELYRQMKVNDGLMREAVSSTKAAVIVYDPSKDTLRFMNSGDGRVHLPDMIHEASLNLMNYLPGTEKTLEQVGKIFHGLNRIKTEGDFELTLEIEGKPCDFTLHAKAMRDENGNVLTYVGIVEDITNWKQSQAILQEKAERDFLTGLYNRRSAVEQISNMLKIQGGGKMKKQAFS